MRTKGPGAVDAGRANGLFDGTTNEKWALSGPS